jgi:hypothetical protein
LQLIAGAHNLRNQDAATVQARSVAAIYPHNLYSTRPKKYDVAIVKTVQPFQLTTYVSVIELTKQKPQGIFVGRDIKVENFKVNMIVG